VSDATPTSPEGSAPHERGIVCPFSVNLGYKEGQTALVRGTLQQGSPEPVTVTLPCYSSNCALWSEQHQACSLKAAGEALAGIGAMLPLLGALLPTVIVPPSA
jgi:hypothetical protein